VSGPGSFGLDGLVGLLRFSLILTAGAALCLAALQVLAQGSGKARPLLVVGGWLAGHANQLGMMGSTPGTRQIRGATDSPVRRIRQARRYGMTKPPRVPASDKACAGMVQSLHGCVAPSTTQISLATVWVGQTSVCTHGTTHACIATSKQARTRRAANRKPDAESALAPESLANKS
jgi:hypothetical protein